MWGSLQSITNGAQQTILVDWLRKLVVTLGCVEFAAGQSISRVHSFEMLIAFSVTFRLPNAADQKVLAGWRNVVKYIHQVLQRYVVLFEKCRQFIKFVTGQHIVRYDDEILHLQDVLLVQICMPEIIIIIIKK